MGHTRQVPIPAEAKLSPEALLKMIADADSAGFPVYVQTAIACIGKRTLAKMHDNGLIRYERLAFGQVVHVV